MQLQSVKIIYPISILAAAAFSSIPVSTILVVIVPATFPAKETFSVCFVIVVVVLVVVDFQEAIIVVVPVIVVPVVAVLQEKVIVVVPVVVVCQ